MIRVLALPSDRGVRAVALDQLLQANAAAQHLEDAPDDDALHEFRVAVRRLRTWGRAFDTQLGDAASLSIRQRLRDIGQSTNLERDTVVQLEWLRHERSVFTGPRQRGFDWLGVMLEARRRRVAASEHASTLSAFRTVSRELLAPLETQPSRARSGKPRPALGALLALRIDAYAIDLEEAMMDLISPADDSAAHEARIAAKRLRHLLEPAVKETGRGEKLLHRLRRLQDGLGALHDRHVFGHVVNAARISAGPAASRAGLVAIQSRLRKQASATFRDVRKHWVEKEASTFRRGVARFSRSLIRLQD